MRAAASKQGRRLEAMREQAQRDLVAAIEERARADAEIDRALLAAHELGIKADVLVATLGVSHATYFRRVKAAQEKASGE